MTFEIHSFIPEDKTAAIQNLMVVDDNDVDQMIYRRIIKRSGLVGTLYQFLSAEDALQHLRRKDCGLMDAILLDINMPRMDGFEFLSAATEEMGNSFTAMVVIMLTTSLDPRDENRAAQFPVVKEYLNKPLVTQHLVEISEYLARKARSSQRYEAQKLKCR